MSARTDENGRAYAGSQRQIQTYVNLHAEVLNEAIFKGLPDLLARRATLEWVSPLEEDGFLEYRDEDFLAAVGHQELAPGLAAFWPRLGPQWDALARVHLPPGTTTEEDTSGVRPTGVLLLEAKSYPSEMESEGCRAAGGSRALIERSLAEARRWFGAEESDWCGPLYQMANRLAHVYFLRERTGASAWLVNLCFVDDARTPTSGEEWRQALASARQVLGFGTREIPWVADVFLPGLGPELFDRKET